MQGPIVFEVTFIFNLEDFENLTILAHLSSHLMKLIICLIFE